MAQSCTRRDVLLAGASGLIAVLGSPSLIAATGIFAEAKIKRVVSRGGIEAWVVQDATVPLIAVEFAFRGGATQDPTDKPGVSHMVAGLLDQGAGALDATTFHQRLDRRAIELSFESDRNRFRGSLRTLKDSKDEAFDLLRMALTSPRFDTADVERIRAGALANLRHELTDPSSLALRKFYEVAFTGHPYARQAGGTLDSAPKINQADLKTYVGGVFAKDTLKIVVVGDIDPEALSHLLDRTFSSLPEQSNATPIPEIIATKPPQRSYIPLDVPQTFVTFGGPGVRRDEPDFMPAFVVNHILGGGGLTSRLFREVREKRGLAYFVSEELVWMDHSAVFVGSSGTHADRAGETVQEIEKQVRNIAERGPTQQELDDAKSYVKGSQILALNTSSKLARTLLQHQLDRLPIDYLEKHDAIVDAVTLEDAKRVAARLWGDGLLTVLVGRSPVP